MQPRPGSFRPARPAGCLLRPLTGERAPPGATVCVALVHNEVNLLPAFLDHYRGLGPMAFVIVDDRSDDGSRALLEAAPDVTLYAPEAGSSYARDKRAWRSDLLDAWADGGWCLVPDVDEHLVWLGMARSGLRDLIAALEVEGAAALMAVMIDMYADAPLAEHRFDGGDAAALAATFPLFDGPAPPPLGYRLLPPARRFRRRYPTPPVMAWGGLRERLFFAGAARATALQTQLLSAWAHMGRPLAPGPLAMAQNAVVRAAVKPLYSADPFTVTKLPLLRWRRGLAFSGGPHAVNARLSLSHRIAGLLHYKFTRGAAGIAYTARRGQHAGGAQFYRRMLDGPAALEHSPACALSRHHTGPDSLAGILR
jgi:hypothetical protein